MDIRDMAKKAGLKNPEELTAEKLKIIALLTALEDTEERAKTLQAAMSAMAFTHGGELKVDCKPMMQYMEGLQRFGNCFEMELEQDRKNHIISIKLKETKLPEGAIK